MINRILLITPPAFTFKAYRDINPLPPMGLGYLAAAIDGLCIEIKILDALLSGWNNEEKFNDTLIRVGLSDSEIENYICKFEPDIVGVNCQFSRQYKMYHNIFAIIKKIKSDCITIAGGAHVTVCPEEVLNDVNCDFIITGEAEDSFKEFVLNLKNGKEVYSVDGLGWKSNDGIHIAEKKKWIMSLDSIPFPSYHIMDLGKYFGLPASHGVRHKNKFCPIITSRGCPAKCTFCSAHKVWGNVFRFRSVNNVLEEMRILKERYNIEELMFEDDNVTANPKRAKELFSRMIDEKFNFVWDTPNGVGVWSIDEELLNLMKQAGCIKLNFPIESGSQYVLDHIIKKPLNLSKVKELIKHCRKINLDYSIFLVIGMPGEKADDIWQSFKFVADCECYNPHISIATPYPGTKLLNDSLERKFFSKEFNLDDLFTRSFMLKTEDWDENKLRRILLMGHLYLKFRRLLSNPVSILKLPLLLFKYRFSINSYIKEVLKKETLLDNKT